MPVSLVQSECSLSNTIGKCSAPSGDTALYTSRNTGGMSPAVIPAMKGPYQSGAPCGTDPAHSPRLPIGGVSAWLVEAGCPLPADNTFSAPDVRYTAFAFAGGRVYLVSLDGAVDLRWFEDISATIRLDPASAIDP